MKSAIFTLALVALTPTFAFARDHSIPADLHTVTVAAPANPIKTSQNDTISLSSKVAKDLSSRG